MQHSRAGQITHINTDMHTTASINASGFRCLFLLIAQEEAQKHTKRQNLMLFHAELQQRIGILAKLYEVIGCQVCDAEDLQCFISFLAALCFDDLTNATCE